MFRKPDRFACARQALERRDYAAALRELDAVLAEPATEAERAFLFNKRGVAQIGLERREEARADFARALEAQPRYAPALTNLGNLLLEAGEVEDAILFYERAIAGDAEYALAHFNLGVAYKRAGRVAEGVRALRRAQRLEQRSRASAPRSFPPARPW